MTHELSAHLLDEGDLNEMTYPKEMPNYSILKAQGELKGRLAVQSLLGCTVKITSYLCVSTIAFGVVVTEGRRDVARHPDLHLSLAEHVELDLMVARRTNGVSGLGVENVVHGKAKPVSPRASQVPDGQDRRC